MSIIDNIKELESKQKVMLVAIVLLLGVVVYMGYTTFFPSSSVNVPAPKSVPVRQAVPASKVQAIKNTTLASQDERKPQGSQESSMEYLAKPKTNAPTPEQLAILAQSQQLQEEYIHLVSQYQIAQLEQKLAKTNAEIAKQKLETTKSVLATQKLEGNANQTPTLSTTTSGTVTGKAKAPNGAIQVMFVGRQNGKWSAMLGGNGTYFEVNVGTRLPDGSVVSRISQKGVTLNKSGHSIYLAIPKTLD